MRVRRVETAEGVGGACAFAYGIADGVARRKARRVVNRMAAKFLRRLKAPFLSRRGFTLIELMIVIAIIGILTAILIPRVLAALSLSQVNTAANEIRVVHTGIEEYYNENGGFPALTGTSPTCSATVSGTSPTTCWTTLDNAINPYVALASGDQQLYGLTSVTTSGTGGMVYQWYNTGLNDTFVLTEQAPSGTTGGTYTVTAYSGSGTSGTKLLTVSGTW